MTTDRELLEKAAKAAGMEIDPIDAMHEPEQWYAWNPLTDDGDALRLAVDLKMKITVGNAIVMVEAIGIPDVGVPFTGDAREATRRAIVRAAAAIGEQMP